MLSVILGLINVIPLGIANAMSRKPSQTIGGKKLMFFRQIITSLGLLIILLFNLKTTHFDTKMIIFTFIISIICYFAVLTMYKAIEVGKVGIVSPINSSYVIYSLILTTLFFKTTTTALQLYSVIAIIIGIIFISLNFKDIKSGEKKGFKGIAPAFFSSLFFGLFFFLAQFSNRTLGPFLTSFLIELSMFIYVAIDLRKIDIRLDEIKKISGIIIWVGALNVLAITAFYYGLSATNPAIFLVISSSSPLVMIFYGHFVFKEKLMIQQYAAALLILAGICIIAIK